MYVYTQLSNWMTDNVTMLVIYTGYHMGVSIYWTGLLNWNTRLDYTGLTFSLHSFYLIIILPMYVWLNLFIHYHWYNNYSCVKNL